MTRENLAQTSSVFRVDRRRSKFRSTRRWPGTCKREGGVSTIKELEREEEVELARRLISGETEAFDRFVEHFRAKSFHYSWLMCGQREDAEEVSQETLLKVFENFDRLREPEKVRPWVFQIAKNACLVKRQKSIFAPSRELSLDEFLPAMGYEGGHRKLQIADWSRLPDRQFLRGEMKDVLDRAIAELPENYKSVVLLRDIEELSTEETAQVLALTADVVKTRLHRGRLAIRQKLDEYLQGGLNGAPSNR